MFVLFVEGEFLIVKGHWVLTVELCWRKPIHLSKGFSRNHLVHERRQGTMQDTTVYTAGGVDSRNIVSEYSQFKTPKGKRKKSNLWCSSCRVLGGLLFLGPSCNVPWEQLLNFFRGKRRERWGSLCMLQYISVYVHDSMYVQEILKTWVFVIKLQR